MRTWMAGTLLALAAGTGPLPAAAPGAAPPGAQGPMHRGRSLQEVWTAPGFDPARGFRTGTVALAPGLAGLYGPVVAERFPERLARLADPASDRVLDLTITELTLREQAATNAATVRLGVQGRIRDGDGTPLAAFAARAAGSTSAGPAGSCEEAMDRVVTALAAEFGLRLKRPSELKAAARADGASRPPAAVQPASPVATSPASQAQPAGGRPPTLATTPSAAGGASQPSEHSHDQAAAPAAGPGPVSTQAPTQTPAPTPAQAPAPTPAKTPAKAGNPVQVQAPEPREPRSRGQHF